MVQGDVVEHSKPIMPSGIQSPIVEQGAHVVQVDVLPADITSADGSADGLGHGGEAPMQQLALQAGSPTAGLEVVAGLTLTDQNEVQGLGKRGRGKRSVDKRPRKKRGPVPRNCAHCSKFGGGKPSECKGAGGKRWCEYFELDGAAKPGP